MDNKKVKVIEICGLPRTGKTTNCRMLGKTLSKQGFKVHVIQDLTNSSPIKNKRDHYYFFSNLLRIDIELIATIFNKDLDYLIIDRGLVDSFFWINHLNNTGTHKLKLGIHKIKNLLQLFVEFINYRAFFFDLDPKLYYGNYEDCKLILCKEEIFSTYGKTINLKDLRGYKSTYLKLEHVISCMLNSEIIYVNASNYENKKDRLLKSILSKVLIQDFWEQKIIKNNLSKSNQLMLNLTNEISESLAMAQVKNNT